MTKDIKRQTIYSKSLFSNILFLQETHAIANENRMSDIFQAYCFMNANSTNAKGVATLIKKTFIDAENIEMIEHDDNDRRQILRITIGIEKL